MKKGLLTLGLVGVIAVGSAACETEKDTSSSKGAVAEKSADKDSATTATTVKESKNPRLFAGRLDAQKEDQERNIGGSVELSGYTSTVSAAKFQQTLSMIEEDGYIVADVTVLNRDKKAQSYNLFDWKLQTPSGQVIDPGFSSIQGTLSSGDLITGGTVSGKVVFETGAQKGDFYIIYKPDAFDSARGIWKVTV
jgi:hypothetical protein